MEITFYFILLLINMIEVLINRSNYKNEIRELVYQKGKFDLNRSVLEEIQNKRI